MTTGSLWHKFWHGKLHVYYGLIIMLGVALWQVVSGNFIWLVVVVISSAIFADLWAHNYPHEPPCPQRL